MKSTKISILCSGVALGVYIPAILTNSQLSKQGMDTEVYVLESLMKDEKIEKISENKKAFHNNFRFALAGQKLSRDLMPMMNMAEVYKLLRLWESENRRQFIIFSGFWMPIIKEYISLIGNANLDIDIIHMDADISVSWKQYYDESLMYNNIWLFNWNDKKIINEIRVGNFSPISINERNARYVIHGGGWGMGTYQSKIPELKSVKKELDIIIYDTSEVIEQNENNRFFMIDPAWAPWIKDDQYGYIFPPFGEIKKGIPPVFAFKNDYHELYDVIRSNLAIISKPGGATLLDSLSSATPIVMLEPFGEYEEKNAALWKHLGFGIYYDEWKSLNFSDEVIYDLHKNLLKFNNVLPCYTKGKSSSDEKVFVSNF